MLVRQTLIEDIDEVMRVLADGRAAIATFGIDQWQAGYPFRSTIESDIAAGKSYVLVDEDEIVATFMYEPDGEPTYDNIDGAWLSRGNSAQPSYACMHRVAVAEGKTGKGYAKRMVHAALEHAREDGFEGLRIDTHPGNLAMRGLVEGLGFDYCGMIYIAHAGEGTPDRVAYERLV